MTRGTGAGAKMPARFVTGSILGHVVTMTLTSAIGLMALFLVDFADLFFLSLLGKTEITAAIGFAGMIAFSSLSVSIGIGIAAAALVATNLGAGNTLAARRFASSTLVISVLAPALVGLCIFAFANNILAFLGARGDTLAYGAVYLRTVVFGFPLLGGAVALSFSLRAIGDARRAMYVTLVTAIGNAILDPVFIFGLDLSIRGAALATICANLASFVAGMYGLYRVHGFLEAPAIAALRRDARAIGRIAFPATLTQLATPFSIAYITWTTAPFGDEAVAGTAIVNRLVPVAFGIIFSLSGAVGPIAGQNFGARNHARLRETINKAMALNAAYTISVAFILWLLAGLIPQWFLAKGEARTLVTFFCTWLSASWCFTGAQFVAQAAFNNLGKPLWSTMFNWGRATFGTIPFVYLGARQWGPEGIMAGYAAGAVASGLIAAVFVYRLIDNIEKNG